MRKNKYKLVRMLNKLYLLLMLTMNFNSIAQQEAKIIIEGGKKKQSTNNDITIIQQSNDSSKKAEINLKNSSRNKAIIRQIDTNRVMFPKVEKKPVIKNYIENANVFVGFLVSIVTLISFTYGVYKFLKKKNKK